MGGRSRGFISLCACWFLNYFIATVYGYDSLDPNSNVTIKWDVMQEHDGTQDVRVSIFNYQLYRHIDPPPPGWRLTWTWKSDEVIWGMWGAEAAEQGNCSKFKGHTLPHCCEKNPVIIDLLPGTPYNKQVANCCKGGVLSSMLQDIDKSVASFQMSIGMASLITSSDSDGDSNITFSFPDNFQLGIPGYTCGLPVSVPPSKFFEDQGRRRTQALRTWNITCNYSQYRAATTPTCCVSLSSFYDKNIVSCPTCSCGCPTLEKQCVKAGELPPVLQLQPNEAVKPVVQCTEHMCPIKVHWHVKQSYREYWRVKMTVTNFNYVKNYSQWSVVVQHPNLKSVVQVFSFNYKPLHQYVDTNDSGIFYGLKYYNDMLLQSGQYGNVQTEMLLRKDEGMFTFSNGWAFPRQISFNGDQCVMPQADVYPTLPSSSPRQLSSGFLLLLFAIVLSLLLSTFNVNLIS